ncbi:MAG: LamG domain-containing protein [Candidatus Omnitrophica bacterium]|nr:LamG domain-containing protein [Candidatus Omnitrophota bacterium]
MRTFIIYRLSCTLNVVTAGFLLSPIYASGLQFQHKDTYTTEKEEVVIVNKGRVWEDLLAKEEYLGGCFKGKFIIQEPFVNISPHYPGSNWYGKNSGEEEFLPGYEAGIILRKKDGFYYRVCFSTTYKEIGIWKKNGGWIAIKDYPFEIGKEYEFNIEFSGNRIKVNINGQDIIDFYDVRPVIQKGKLGLSCKESSVIFKHLSFTFTKLDSKRQENSHLFYYRKWHNYDWIFDNFEPICKFNRDDMTLYLIKLAPSFRPIGYFPLCWLQYLGPDWYANKIEKFEVIEQGEKIKFLAQGTTLKKEIISKYVVTISYDKENKSYIYDIEAEFEVCEGKTWPNAYSLEFFNFLPYNVVNASIELHENQRWENYYGWIVWKSKNGNFLKHPINHNGFYPGYGEKSEFLSLSKKDGFLGFFSEEVNPVFRLVKSMESDEIIQRLCAWSHDIHIAYDRPKNSLQPGVKYFIHYQLTGLSREKAEEILNSSQFPPDVKNPEYEYPYYKKGGNDFKNGIKIASPHQVMLWRKGKNQYAWFETPEFWDKKNGYNDNFSIKIDGPCEVRAGIGPSWFGENYTEKKYFITAYVKTQNVKGSGPYIGFECYHKKDRKDYLFTHINGTKDWTKIGFITEKLTGLIQGDLILGLDGTGTCWFDNVEINEVREGDQIEIPEWEKMKSPPALKDLIVWLKFEEEGNGVFDHSYNGNSAEIRNLKWTKDENKDFCIEFDGKGILTIKDKEELNFRNGFTFCFDIKPNEEFKLFDGATILRKYNHLVVSLMGKKSPYRIGVDINGKWGKNITEPIIYGGKWTKIILTYDNNMIKVYVDGNKVFEKEQKEEKIIPSPFPLCIGGFWHEGKISQYKLFEGKISQIRLYSYPLSEEKVRTMFLEQ